MNLYMFQATMNP